MRRTFLSTLLAAGFIAACASARETAPFRAAQLPDGKKASPQPDSRAKIIDELRADYNDAVDGLGAKNTSAAIRAKQQRIIENLKILLENDDPPPTPGDNSPPSPPPAPPPSGAQDNPPKPAPERSPAPQPKNVQAEPQKPRPTVVGNKGASEAPPRTIEELRKDKSTGGGYMELPPRQREAMDAYTRERFPPRYEELLRAYYRNLAAGDRRTENE